MCVCVCVTENGAFKDTYREIISGSSSVKLIFSSVTIVNFSVTMHRVKSQGNGKHDVDFFLLLKYCNNGIVLYVSSTGRKNNLFQYVTTKLKFVEIE